MVFKSHPSRSDLEYLNQVKQKHSKVRHINHSSIDMQEYLEGSELNAQESKFMFAARSRMIDVKTNYREKYFHTICPCCNLEEDSQEHLLTCYMLEEEGEMVSISPNYQDLFSTKLGDQVEILRILKARFARRKKNENHSL